MLFRGLRGALASALATWCHVCVLPRLSQELILRTAAKYDQWGPLLAFTDAVVDCDGARSKAEPELRSSQKSQFVLCTDVVS